MSTLPTPYHRLPKMIYEIMSRLSLCATTYADSV